MNGGRAKKRKRPIIPSLPLSPSFLPGRLDRLVRFAEAVEVRHQPAADAVRDGPAGAAGAAEAELQPQVHGVEAVVDQQLPAAPDAGAVRDGDGHELPALVKHEPAVGRRRAGVVEARRDGEDPEARARSETV